MKPNAAILPAMAVAIAMAMLVASQTKAEKKSVPFFEKPSWTPQRDAEKRAAELASPHVLRPPVSADGAPPRPVRIRVYVDHDYRAGTPHWQTRVRALVERVNAFVEPGFSVRLQIESAVSWDRRSSGTSLTEALRALELRDPGGDVDWVVGLVSALPGVSNDIHELGMAPVLGKHFVLRGADDAREGLSIDENLRRLTDDERDDLYRSRKQHRETVLFLHEWAHTLGALHDAEPDRIMNASYRLEQVGFSADNVAIMRLDLDARIGPSFDLQPLLTFVETHPLDDARAQDRETLLRLLRSGKAPPSSPPAAPPGMSTAPAAAAIDVAPASDEPELVRTVRKLLADGQRQQARERVDGAKRLAREGNSPAARVAVAAAYKELGMVTLVEEAVAAASDAVEAKELSRWVSITRAHAGLPKNASLFKVTVDDEPAYLDMVARIEGRFDAHDETAATTLIREGLGRYPGAPGLLALRCDSEVRAGKPTLARRTCDTALKPDDVASRAHRLLASLDIDAGHVAEARAHLLRALALDPDDGDAMGMLVRLHR